MTALELISITKENQFAENLSALVQEMKVTPVKTSSKLNNDSSVKSEVLLIDEDAISDQPENNLNALRKMFPFSRQILFTNQTQENTLHNYLEWGCNCLVMKNESKNNMKKAILGTYEKGFYLNNYFKTLLNISSEGKIQKNVKVKQPQKMN